MFHCEKKRLSVPPYLHISKKSSTFVAHLQIHIHHAENQFINSYLIRHFGMGGGESAVS